MNAKISKFAKIPFYSREAFVIWLNANRSKTIILKDQGQELLRLEIYHTGEILDSNAHSNIYKGLFVNTKELSSGTTLKIWNNSEQCWENHSQFTCESFIDYPENKSKLEHSLEVFICGPTFEIERLNIETFQEVSNTLKSLGLIPIIPHDLAEGLDVSEEDFYNICISKLALCPLVVTLPGFAFDPQGKIQIAIARMMTKKIIPALRRDDLEAYASLVTEGLSQGWNDGDQRAIKESNVNA